jgi:FHS family glucose/mannose:H+ symporter-like MFS transporter
MQKISSYKNNLILLYFALGLASLTINATHATLEQVKSVHGLSLAVTGLIPTTIFIGFLIAVLGGAAISEKFGVVLVLKFGLVVLIFSQIFFSIASSLYFILISAFGIGIAGGLIEGGVSTFIASIFGTSAASPMNTSQVFYGFGAIIGPLIIGITRGCDILWPINFIIIAALTSIIFWSFSQKSIKIKLIPNKLNQKLFPLKKDEFMLIIIISLIMMFYVGVEVSLAAWLGILGEQDIGMAKREASLLISIFWLGITFGRIIAVRIKNPLYYASSVGLMASIGGIQILILPLVDNSLSALMLSFGIGLMFGGIWPITLTLGAINFKRKKELAIGFFIAIGAFGGSFMPGFFGLIAERFTLQSAFKISGFIMISVALLSFILNFTGYTRYLRN